MMNFNQCEFVSLLVQEIPDLQGNDFKRLAEMPFPCDCGIIEHLEYNYELNLFLDALADMTRFLLISRGEAEMAHGDAPVHLQRYATFRWLKPELSEEMYRESVAPYLFLGLES